MPIFDEETSCIKHFFTPDRGPESKNGNAEPKFLLRPISGPSDLSKEDGDEEEYFTGKNIRQKLVFFDSEYQDSLLSRLNTLRRNRKLCDVVLFVDQREIYAHRAVLAGLSPTLYDLFTGATNTNGNNLGNQVVQNGATEENGETVTSLKNGWAEEKQQTGHLTTACSCRGSGPDKLMYLEFNNVRFECFEAIVDYAYTSKLEIPCGLVADLYKTACMLRVGLCAKVCANYLADNLSPENCIGVRRCANKTNDSLLASSVDTYIQQNFNRIVHESTEFTSLPLVQVEVIWTTQSGAADTFRDDGECKRLGERILEYFQTQELPEHMEFRMEQLTEKVHLLHAGVDLVLQDCADMDDTSSVGSCDLVQDYKKCYAKDKRGKCISPSHTRSASGCSGGQTAPTNGLAKLARFSSSDSINSSNSLAESDEIEWRLITMTKPSMYYCIALGVLHRQLVALSIQLIQDSELSGCITEEREQAGVSDLFQPFGRVQIPNMASPRCSVGAVNLHGKVFVCGGYERGECMRTVEEYDPKSNRWSSVTPMQKERGRFDATVCNGKIYAVGGSDSRKDLDSAEVYDPDTGQWSLLPRMNIAKSNNGCASVDGMVYCIGGWNGQAGIKLCEKFDPERNVWEVIASLSLGRSQASCTSWNWGILAVGGGDGWTCTNAVEFYEPRTNSWKQLSTMTTPRRGCGTTVLNDKLYVAGGSDGVNSLSSVEILDLKEGAWTQGPPLTTPRTNVHLVTIDETIYAVGGFNGKTFLNSMECFEPASGHGWRSWVSMSSRSRQNSRTYAAAVKDNLEVGTDESGCDLPDASSGLSSPASLGL